MNNAVPSVWYVLVVTVTNTLFFLEYAENIGETAEEKAREREQSKILGLLDQFSQS